MYTIEKWILLLLGSMALMLSSVSAYAETPRPADGGGHHYDNGRGHHTPPPPKKGRVHRDSGSGAAVAVAAGAVTMAVLADVAMNAAVPEDDYYMFGIGVRGFGNAATNMRVGGGIGVYLWLRPIRWVSVEAYSDLILNRSPCNVCDRSYARIPLYFGLRAHLFDYKPYDVYAAIAGGVNFQYADHYERAGGGMQLGGGASFKISKYDIGFDIRYTLESNYLPLESNGRNPSVIHGCTFALTMGLAV